MAHAPLHLETQAGAIAGHWILSADPADRSQAVGEPLALPISAGRPDHIELRVVGAHDAITLHDQLGNVIPGRVHRAGASVFAALPDHVTHVTPRHALGAGRRTSHVTVTLYPKEARA